MITDEDKERVRQATDFQALVSETVVLRQRGHDFWGCCPFHQEKNPSFHINPSTGLWNCFGCHKGGDVFDYVMNREHLDFLDAVRYLADRAGIELSEEQGSVRKGPKRNRLIEALTEAEAFYSTMLLRGRGEGSDSARTYFKGRAFGSDICRRWGLGYAPGRGSLVSHLRSKGFSAQELVAADLALDRSGRLVDRFFERVMFPIHDEMGRTIGFGGRVMGDGKPKYLNTRETNVFHKSKHLFGFDHAKETVTVRSQAIVVEGYTDVIAMHEAGFTNTVAALGTALSLDHVKLLERFGASSIICMFDGDAAGQKAAELSVQYVDKTKAEMRCVTLPDNQDPAEFLADHGAEALKPYLEKAQPLINFVFEKKLQGYDTSVPGQRVAALKDLAGVLAPLRGSVLLDDYATRLANLLNMDVNATKKAIQSAPEQAQGRAQGQPEAYPGPEPDEVPYDYEPFDDRDLAMTTMAAMVRTLAMAMALRRSRCCQRTSAPCFPTRRSCLRSWPATSRPFVPTRSASVASLGRTRATRPWPGPCSRRRLGRSLPKWWPRRRRSCRMPRRSSREDEWPR